MLSKTNSLRFDHRIIASWIEPGCRVLALGCGEGHLLQLLKREKQVLETGIEIVESRVVACIEKGLSVLQGDINEELRDYPDRAVDCVVLSQTLQEVFAPSELIQEMLRVGERAIVSFPNFGHWRLRAQLFFSGRAPITRDLPYEWYATPNIRVLSISDFKRFAETMGIRILRETAIISEITGSRGRVVRFLPNFRATYGIFELTAR